MEIERFVKDNKEIGRSTAHIMIIGCPGNGKTHLLDNLLKRQRSKDSSTGVSRTPVLTELTPSAASDELTPSAASDELSPSAAIGVGLSWTILELDISFMMQVQQHNKLATHDNGQIENSASSDLMSEHLSDEESGKKGKKLKHNNMKSSTNIITVSQQSNAEVSEGKSSLRNNILEVFNQYNMTSIEDLKSTCSLYFRDTGGQIEFQEVLSILINGPSIFFFVIKTHESLNKPLILEYRENDGTIKSFTSTMTTHQALVQTLTTIQTIAKPKNVDTHDSMVFIIGTHTDKLKSSKEAKIDALNVELHDIIKCHKFEGLIEYKQRESEDVVFPVSNTEPDDKDFELIRKRINFKMLKTSIYKINYPLGYLLFSLELQRYTDEVLNREKCERIAAKYSITGKEKVTDMLTFLHHRIGILCYYNIDGLRHLVIRNPKVLFDKLTELMVKTFPSSDILQPSTREDLLKGIIEDSDFQKLFYKDDIMTSEQFILFLEHLRIAAPFNYNNKKYYFIPAVITHLSLVTDNEVAPKRVCPLAITFESSCCPKGVFGMTICHFMAQKKDNCTFSLQKSRISKNIVYLEGVLNKIEGVVGIKLQSVDEPLSSHTSTISYIFPKVIKFIRIFSQNLL